MKFTKYKIFWHYNLESFVFHELSLAASDLQLT